LDEFSITSNMTQKLDLVDIVIIGLHVTLRWRINPPIVSSNHYDNQEKKEQL